MYIRRANNDVLKIIVQYVSQISNLKLAHSVFYKISKCTYKHIYLNNFNYKIDDDYEHIINKYSSYLIIKKITFSYFHFTGPLILNNKNIELLTFSNCDNVNVEMCPNLKQICGINRKNMEYSQILYLHNISSLQTLYLDNVAIKLHDKNINEKCTLKTLYYKFNGHNERIDFELIDGIEKLIIYANCCCSRHFIYINIWFDNHFVDLKYLCVSENIYFHGSIDYLIENLKNLEILEIYFKKNSRRHNYLEIDVSTMEELDIQTRADFKLNKNIKTFRMSFIYDGDQFFDVNQINKYIKINKENYKKYIYDLYTWEIFYYGHEDDYVIYYQDMIY